MSRGWIPTQTENSNHHKDPWDHKLSHQSPCHIYRRLEGRFRGSRAEENLAYNQKCSRLRSAGEYFRTSHICHFKSTLPNPRSQNYTHCEQHPPVYALLFGSQIVSPWAGPHVPSVEKGGACLSWNCWSSDSSDRFSDGTQLQLVS